MRNQPAIIFIGTIILFASVMICSNFSYSEIIKSSNTSKQDNIIWHERYRHIDSKTGFRTAYYRARLPNTVPGGKRITVNEAYTHYQNKSALFVDVMAHTGTGPDPIDGHWRLAAPRKNIPGSIWLADVGTGTLSKEMMTYYRSNLARITNKDKTKPLIIYCTADCWMAWNAVRRAAKWGYKNLLWFPQGSDEWKIKGYPLAQSTPVPLPPTD